MKPPATEFYLRRETRWASVVFLGVINAVTFVVLPIYVWKRGVSGAELALFTFYFLTTSFAITVGYHRCFAHSTFKAGKLAQFLLLFFGAAAFEQSALKWASLHRTHHQFVDTPKDPYNIQMGFFYAHIGWILFWKRPVHYDNVKDLQKNPLVMHQHRHFQQWAIIAGILMPLAVGAATGHLLGALLWSVAARMTLVFHSAFFINSFAHSFGNQPYDRHSSAKDNWLGAVLTNGEGYHNYHHKFPQDYRNGIRWYHWDPTKWIIWGLSKLGMARDLMRTPEARIRQAREAVETLSA